MIGPAYGAALESGLPSLIAQLADARGSRRGAAASSRSWPRPDRTDRWPGFSRCSSSARAPGRRRLARDPSPPGKRSGRCWSERSAARVARGEDALPQQRRTAVPGPVDRASPGGRNSRSAGAPGSRACLGPCAMYQPAGQVEEGRVTPRDGPHGPVLATARMRSAAQADRRRRLAVGIDGPDDHPAQATTYRASSVASGYHCSGAATPRAPPVVGMVSSVVPGPERRPT